MTSQSDPLPFSGINVFDVTQGVAGPHATMLLAQHGAEVVKVEPLEGDWARGMGKPYDDLSAYSIAFNRGKRSIALDLKSAEGRAVAQKLAFSANVVVEAFRPGVMAKLGLGYEEVKKHNPQVIYLSITGFGQKGPKSSLPVTDSVIQAFSGWMTPARGSKLPPMRSEMLPMDVMTGLYAFQALAPAIMRQFRFGKGAYIDCSMMQSGGAFQAAKVLENYLEDGNPRALYVPSGVLATADGHVSISGMREEHWRALCKVIGIAEFAYHPRFDNREKRVENEAELMETLQAEFRKFPTDALSKALNDAGIINSRVNSYLEFMRDPQQEAIDAQAWVDHPEVGRVPIPNLPGRHLTPDDKRAGHCPHVGQHSREILRELGYDDAFIAEAMARKAVGSWRRQAQAAE